MYSLFVDTDCDMTPELCEKYGAHLIVMPYTLLDKEVNEIEDQIKFELTRSYHAELRG